MTKTNQLIIHLQTLFAKELKVLEFGCEVEEIYWYKTETDKKKNKPDWMYSREGGDYGIVVKDLRDEFLPMWIDKGDQLEFQVQPNDIVSMKIIGKPPEHRHLLMALKEKNNNYHLAHLITGYVTNPKEKWDRNAKSFVEPLLDLNLPLTALPEATSEALLKLLGVIDKSV